MRTNKQKILGIERLLIRPIIIALSCCCEIFLLTRNKIQKINWQQESNEPNNLKKAPPENLASSPKRPEVDFNYKSTVK